MLGLLYFDSKGSKMPLDIHITGTGLITSGGATAAENWKTLCHGKNNFIIEDGSFISRLQPQVAESIAALRSDKLLLLVDRIALMGITSAREATSHVSPSVLKSSMVIVGTSRGSLESNENAIRKYDQTGEIEKFRSMSTHIGSISAAISYSLGCKGSSMTIGSACISGIQAIGIGATLIKEGHSNTAIVGGMEAPLTTYTLKQIKTLGIQTTLTEKDFPCKPFHPNRGGTVFGEGAATLFLEKNPSGPSLGIIKSYYATIESGMKPGHSEHAQSLGTAVMVALERAGIAGSDIDLIVGHGSGTEVGDDAEQRCYRAIFGDSVPFIALNKWALGHLVGGSGALNTVMACFHMKEGFVPAHPYFDATSPFSKSLSRQIKTVLVAALGLGGGAAALIIQKPNN